MLSKIKISHGITVQSEIKNLTWEEKDILMKIKNRKRRFFISTLVGFLILIPIGWYLSIDRQYVGLWRQNEESIHRMNKMTPYFYFFVLLLITGYFINYYFRLLHPLVKDLKKGVKEILYYDPGKYQTPFFAEYYIITPLKKKNRVKISKEFFDEIQPGAAATISYSIYSYFIFSIDINGKEIKFNETNEPIDA